MSWDGERKGGRRSGKQVVGLEEASTVVELEAARVEKRRGEARRSRVVQISKNKIALGKQRQRGRNLVFP